MTTTIKMLKEIQRKYLVKCQSGMNFQYFLTIRFVPFSFKTNSIYPLQLLIFKHTLTYNSLNIYL